MFSVLVTLRQEEYREKFLKDLTKFARTARQGENFQAERFDVTSLSHGHVTEASVSSTTAVSLRNERQNTMV